MEEGSSWVKTASMVTERREHRMVAYGNAIFAVSGWNGKGNAMKSTEWFDGTSWTQRAWNYDNWGIGVTCLALDSEADIFYMLGGYCPS